MDNAKTTPKDFFLWAGAMVSFYWSVVAFLGLIFDYINYAFPNALSYYPSDPYQSGISYEMASIIVLFPLFVILMRVIRADIQKDPSRSQIWVRRWALFLTLFIAGATMAGDIIVLLTSFLNGSDITTAFLLKILVVFLVAAMTFMHFIADYRHYWEKNPSRAHMVGYAAGALALLTIIAGFFIVGTPQHARQMRLDSQRVDDLQSIQSQIVMFWRTKQALPAQLPDLNDSVSVYSVPSDPQTGASYEYQATGAQTFRLCATFTTQSLERSSRLYTTDSSDSWAHAAGRVCFDRTIDPDRYPPYPKYQ